MTGLHHPPDIVLFFGRFHVLLVHLPIGMVVLLAILEVLALFPRFKNANASAGFVITLAALFAVVTAACGWMLSLGGGYAKDLLEWHERLGIATAGGCVLTAVLFHLGRKKAYRVTLFLTLAVLVVAAHLGGSLTHGRNYLTRYAPRALKVILGSGPATLHSPSTNLPAHSLKIPVFSGVIAPVLQSRCVTCHGPDKSKDDLRLDSYAQLLAGGDDGSILDSNAPAQSLLLHRIHLPLHDNHHMPPDGKRQLTRSQIALLNWWVEAGAPETNTVAALHPPKAIRDIIAAGTGAQ